MPIRKVKIDESKKHHHFRCSRHSLSDSKTCLFLKLVKSSIADLTTIVLIHNQLMTVLNDRRFCGKNSLVKFSETFVDCQAKQISHAQRRIEQQAKDVPLTCYQRKILLFEVNFQSNFLSIKGSQIHRKSSGHVHGQPCTNL